MAKTPLGDFKVTTPENPLLSKQAVTSKGLVLLNVAASALLFPSLEICEALLFHVTETLTPKALWS